MPVYEITSPDGRKFRVTAPDGASKEEALARVRAAAEAPKAPDPTEGMSGTDKFLAGAGKGMTDVVRGVGQAVGLVSQDDVDAAKARDAALMKTGAGMAGNIVGNMAATAPTVLIPGAGTVTGSAAIGAAAGALAPVASDESRLANTGLGAAGGAVGAMAANALSRVARPISATPAAQEMLERGVVPTPGMASGPTSIVNRVEQQLESFGPIGWLISHARGRAVKEMNVEALAKAAPGGEKVLTAGRGEIERIGNVLDSAYDSIYSKLPGKTTYDSAFTDAIKTIPSKEGIDLPADLAKRFDSLLKTRVLDRLENGATEDSIRAAHNSLGNLARKFRSSADPDQRALGMAFAEAKAEFRAMVGRQSSGDFKAAMDGLDKNYSALLAVERAADRVGSKEGVFSAAALKQASKKSSAEMREFADTATDVMGRSVPDSGTAGRLFWPGLAAVSGGGAGVNESLGGPGWLTAAALAPLAYSRVGSRYMLGNYPGQATIAEMIRAASPYTGLIGRSALQD